MNTPVMATVIEPLLSGKLIAIRVAAIVIALAIWFATQRLLARRPTPPLPGGLSLADGMHALTARWNRWLNDRPLAADRLLIGSSLGIDLVGLLVLSLSVVGPTLRPFVAMLIVFGLRQLCQCVNPLPPPAGMIWRRPGIPSILVTYDTTTDFFFSGHTSLAVLGAACLASAFGPIGLAVGLVVAGFEIGTVLVLRAHYTMDVFTGMIAALYAYYLAGLVAPTADAWLANLVG